MSKKILSVILVATMVFTMVACGGDVNTSTETGAGTEVSTEAETGATTETEATEL